jgi:hypothetical protein
VDAEVGAAGTGQVDGVSRGRGGMGQPGGGQRWPGVAPSRAEVARGGRVAR